MLGAALREPDPVVIFEHAMLYPMEGELTELLDSFRIDGRRSAQRRCDARDLRRIAPNN
jgi:pyruvate/2-oxoglutarate/acetoin dehydrogenase E1 component